MKSTALSVQAQGDTSRTYRPPFRVLAVGKCRAVASLLERMVSAGPQVELRTCVPDRAGVCALDGQVPDLILVDADSPDFPAARLCQSFKDDLETNAVPLIVVSFCAKACEEALAHGADDFVTPQTLLALQLRRIAALVKVRQARQFLILEEGAREPHFPPLQWRGRVGWEGPVASIQLDHEPSVCTPAVVLFADIRGYSRICESLAPGQVVLLLREYFSLLTQITIEHRGTVFHTAGDCLMAGFGLSTEQSDAADLAMQAARMMMSRFATLAESWLLRFGVTAGLGVGLSAGEVAVAQTVAHLGPPAATSSTLIGDTVNMAARLCQRARDGEIVFSAAFKDTLGDHETASGMIPLLQVVLPGRAGPVDIFCLPIERRSVPLVLRHQRKIEASSIGAGEEPHDRRRAGSATVLEPVLLL